MHATGGKKIDQRETRVVSPRRESSYRAKGGIDDGDDDGNLAGGKGIAQRPALGPGLRVLWGLDAPVVGDKGGHPNSGLAGNE